MSVCDMCVASTELLTVPTVLSTDIDNAGTLNKWAVEKIDKTVKCSLNFRKHTVSNLNARSSMWQVYSAPTPNLSPDGSSPSPRGSSLSSLHPSPSHKNMAWVQLIKNMDSRPTRVHCWTPVLHHSQVTADALFFLILFSYSTFRLTHTFTKFTENKCNRLEGKTTESVHCTITGPCLRMRHRPPARRVYRRFQSAIAKVRYRKGPGWTGLDTNYNCQ